MIPSSIIEEVKRRNDIVSVVEQYVRLTKKTGSNFFGLCPFHAEDTPSFSVAPAKQIYHCFGCQKGGDVISFIMEMEKLSYPDAIRFLAKRSGIVIPETEEDPRYAARRKERNQLRELYLEAARFYYLSFLSKEGQVARYYCESRGLSPVTCKRFGLGYAPHAWDGLLKHLESKNLHRDRTLLERSGLFKKNRSGGLYDLFRDRLMFPFIDETGVVIAFGGRILGEGVPKYVNSPETEIYTKGHHLYALHLAKKSRSSRLLLVEGYLDAIACHVAGVDYAVASLGTALTQRQVELLRRQGKEVIVAFDSDLAGQNAIYRSLHLLEAGEVPVRVLRLTGAKDPDEYVRKYGAERFRLRLEETLPVLDFKLQSALEQSKVQGEVDALAYQKRAFEILSQEKNRVLVEKKLDELAFDLNVSLTVLKQDFEARKPLQQQQAEAISALADAAQKPVEGERVPPLDKETQWEILYLALWLSHPEWRVKTRYPLEAAVFRSMELRRLFDLVHARDQAEKEGNAEDASSSASRIYDDLEACDLSATYKESLIAELMRPENDAADIHTLDQIALQLLLNQALAKLTEYSHLVSSSEKNEEEKEKNLQAIQYWNERSVRYRSALERGEDV